VRCSLPCLCILACTSLLAPISSMPFTELQIRHHLPARQEFCLSPRLKVLVGCHKMRVLDPTHCLCTPRCRPAHCPSGCMGPAEHKKGARVCQAIPAQKQMCLSTKSDCVQPRDALPVDDSLHPLIVRTDCELLHN
jgi:hypothetical protein